MKDNLPILEPLSTATGTLLEPLKLKNEDYVVIWEDKDPRYFRAKTVSATETVPQVIDPQKPKFITEEGKEVFLTQGWTSYPARDFFVRIPENRDLGKNNPKLQGVFRLGGTDFTALMIHHCWPKDRIIFRSQDSKNLYYFVLKRFLSQTIRSEDQARFKLEGILPEMPRTFTDHEELKLSPYQKACVSISYRQGGYAFFMDPGTGKTAPSIARVCAEAKEIRKVGKRMMRVLIIGPNQVRSNWANEFKRFATIPGRTTILKGGKVKRIQLLAHALRANDKVGFTAVIAGWDTFASEMKGEMPIFSRLHWDLIIYDESHYAKGPNTQRFKACAEMRDFSTSRLSLTGSPFDNSLMDLWAQQEALGEGMSGFISHSASREFYGKYERSVRDGAGNSIRKLVGYENIPLFKERLSRMSFSLTKDEANLHLPDKVYDTWEVEMTPKQDELYRQLEAQLLIEIKSELESAGNKTLQVEHILTKLMRLAEITSGYVKWDPIYDLDGGEVIRPGYREEFSPNPKSDAIVEIFKEDFANDPLGKKIIWATFVQNIEAIHTRLQAEGYKGGKFYGATSEKERENVLYGINNDPSYQYLVAHPKAAGAGLNLLGYNPEFPERTDTYVDHMIIISQSWSATERRQLEDRAHRRGTRNNVRITSLICPDTIDQEIDDRVLLKRKRALSLRDIGEILERVLKTDLSEVTI